MYSTWFLFNNLNYIAPVPFLSEEAPIIPEIIKSSCNDFCSENKADSYRLTYNEKSNSYNCLCLDNATQEMLGNNSYDLDKLSFYEEAIKRKDNFSQANDLHWTNLPVTYYITNEEECGAYEVNKINRAFNEMEEATNGTVIFNQINRPANINLTCFFLENCYEKKIEIDEEKGLIYRYETICAHNRGLAKTSVEGDKIIGAEIYLYGLSGFSETTGSRMSGFYVGSCGHTTTEKHEILHTFGFNHKEDPESIMYFAEDSVGYTINDEGECIGSRKEIDKDIILQLIETYG